MHYLNCVLKHPFAVGLSILWLMFGGMFYFLWPDRLGVPLFYLALAMVYWAPVIYEVVVMRRALRNPNALDNKGNTPLHLAVDYRGDTLLVAPLLAHGAQVDARNDAYETSLFIAARTGDIKGMRTLLAHGADMNAINANGDSPVRSAIYLERLSVVNVFIEYGLDLNKPIMSDDTKPLELAIATSTHAIVQSLLAAGANANSVDSQGTSMLQLATRKGNFRMVQALLAAGADPSFVDRQGKTAIDLATVPPVQAVLRDALTKAQK